jgi:hypothetical protein
MMERLNDLREARNKLTETESRAIRKAFRSIIRRRDLHNWELAVLESSLEEVGRILASELALAYPEDTIPVRRQLMERVSSPAHNPIPPLKSRLRTLFCFHDKLRGMKFWPELGAGYHWGWECPKCGKKEY